MATQISTLAKRVAANHEAARKKKKTNSKKKKPTKRKPSSRRKPTSKKPSSRRKPTSKKTPVTRLIERLETTDDYDVPESSEDVLEPGTEFAYGITLIFNASMRGLPYQQLAERKLRSKLKSEIRKALTSAVQITANSYDMADPKIEMMPIRIEKAVNSE